MRLPAHLKRHPTTGLFSFRIATPRRLLDQVGKTEIVVSLQTRSPADAKRLSYFYSAYWCQEFARMSKGDKDLFDSALKSLEGGTARKAMTLNHPSGFSITADTPAEQASLLDRLGSLGVFNVQNPEPVQIAKPAPAQESIMLSSAIAKMKTQWNKKHSNTKTLSSKVKAMEDFRKFIGQDRKQMHNISRRDISDFKEKLEEKNAPATVFIKLLYLKHFFSYLITHGDMVGENPVEGISDFTDDDKKISAKYFGWRAFTDDELQKIFQRENYLRKL